MEPETTGQERKPAEPALGASGAWLLRTQTPDLGGTTAKKRHPQSPRGPGRAGGGAWAGGAVVTGAVGGRGVLGWGVVGRGARLGTSAAAEELTARRGLWLPGWVGAGGRGRGREFALQRGRQREDAPGLEPHALGPRGHAAAAFDGAHVAACGPRRPSAAGQRAWGSVLGTAGGRGALQNLGLDAPGEASGSDGPSCEGGTAWRGRVQP